MRSAITLSVLCCCLVTACSSSSNTAAPTDTNLSSATSSASSLGASTAPASSAPTRSPAEPNVLLCAPSNTEITEAGAQGAAGTQIVDFRIRNVGHKTCRTFGYVGLQFFDADGQKLPTHARRVHGDPPGDPHPQGGPEHVVLNPGQSAYFTFTYRTVGSACEPHYGKTVAEIAVTLPDNEDSEGATVRRSRRTGNVVPCHGHVDLYRIYTR